MQRSGLGVAIAGIVGMLVAPLLAPVLAHAAPVDERSTVAARAARSSATDAARHDMSRPPAACSYRASARDWPAPVNTQACVRERGTDLTVLLVGDSHAEHWAPALLRVARAHNWRLLTLTRAKCDPLDLITVRDEDRGHPTIGEVCERWKKTAYPTVIRRYDPDLVVVAGRSQVQDIRVDGRLIPRSSSAWLPAWRHAWRWTVRATTAGGAKVAALYGQPTMRYDVPDCLDAHGMSSHLCDMRLAGDRDTAQANAFVRRLHSIYSRVWGVPVNGLLCPNGTCRAVMNHQVTHVDSSHLTARFSGSLASRLHDMLGARHLLRN